MRKHVPRTQPWTNYAGYTRTPAEMDRLDAGDRWWGRTIIVGGWLVQMTAVGIWFSPTPWWLNVIAALLVTVVAMNAIHIGRELYRRGMNSGEIR